jgi:tRNA threonylcarbamoyladenosine biosynthesis protein TsaB
MDSTMPNTYILQINTAFSEASIGISKNGELLAESVNPDQHDHAAFLQPAILELCNNVQISLKDFHAVSVVNGPGSYTGLRVGLSSAKGICYALNIPIICINTLDWMAFGNLSLESTLICPMIDARRSEVFTALYDKSMIPMIQPTAMVLDEMSFESLLNQYSIGFVGNGAEKWQAICNHPNASFPRSNQNAIHLSKISYNSFLKNDFADLAYSEPYYIKEFFTGPKA